MHAYILLDRSGSMQGLWDEALGAINGYVAKLGDGHVTLATFDANDGLAFDVLRAGVPSATWKPVSPDEAAPRGMTPLFDAIGRIMALAEKDDPQRAVIVIMTDGQENASRELKKDGARAAIERAEKRGWQVVFLGAEFANFSDADAVGVATGKRMAMAGRSVQASMERLAGKSRRYFDAGEEVAFDAADRAEAGEADVQRRKGS
jgi:hypothetical protein